MPEISRFLGIVIRMYIREHFSRSYAVRGNALGNAPAFRDAGASNYVWVTTHRGCEGIGF